MIDSFRLHKSGRKIKLVIVTDTNAEADDIVSLLRTAIYKYMFDSTQPQQPLAKKRDC